MDIGRVTVIERFFIFYHDSYEILRQKINRVVSCSDEVILLEIHNIPTFWHTPPGGDMSNLCKSPFPKHV